MLRKKQKSTGFTLPEVLMALAVVVVGVLPVSLLFLTSRQLSQQSQVQSAAYNAAREELEKIRAQNYSDRPVGTTTSFTLPSAVTAQFPQASMTGSYYISNYSTDANGVYDTQQIVVRISWTNRESRNDSTSFVQLDTVNSDVAGE